MKAVSICSAALLTGFLTTEVVAASIEKVKRRGTLIVCANPDAMPYSSILDGEPKGLHVDLGNAIARELGVDARFSWTQYRFQAKYVDCDAFMGVGVIGEPDGPVKRSTPLFDFETVLVTRPGRKIERLEDLDGLRVATQTGSLAHVTLLKRDVDVRVSYVRENEMLDALAAGDIDVGIMSNVSLGWYRRDHPDRVFETFPAGIVQSTTGYPIAIGWRKADADTMRTVNEIIAALATSGELGRILDRYGIVPARMPTAKP